jgi:hypothetical protein
LTIAASVFLGEFCPDYLRRGDRRDHDDGIDVGGIDTSQVSWLTKAPSKPDGAIGTFDSAKYDCCSVKILRDCC